MAKTGDRFELPDGSVYAVTAASADSDGEFVEMEWTMLPGTVAPPPHTHPTATEEYEVLEGSFEVMVDGDWRLLAPGQSASVPPGVIHTFRHPGEGVARVRNVHRPASRFDEFVEHMHGLLRSRGITRPKDPRIPVYLSMVMAEYPDFIEPAGPQRFGVKAAAGLGRLLRFKTDVDPNT